MDEQLEIVRNKIVLSMATTADLIEELKQLSRFKPDRVDIAVAILKICTVLRLLQGYQKLEDGEDETAFIISELESAWKMLEVAAGFSSSQVPGPA